MIIHPANHWFETKLIRLEPDEEEIFYRHPTLPLRINQIGMIYFDEEDDVLEGIKGEVYRLRNPDRKGYSSLGTRSRVCYEAYHQAECQGKKFLHVDGNPINCTKENIIRISPPMKTIDPEAYEIYQRAIKAKKKFTDNSVEYMIQREEWVLRKGGDPNHYWQLFGSIPKWLENARNKVLGQPVNLHRITTKKENKYPQEEINEIASLYLSGMTPKQIHKKMQYKSIDDTRRIIRKLRLSRT